MQKKILAIRWLSHLFLIANIVGWLALWIFNIDPCIVHGFSCGVHHLPFEYRDALPPLLKVIGFGTDGIGVLLLVFGWWHLQSILRCLNSHEIFSVTIADRFHKISRLALVWACYYPMHNTLFGVLETWHNGVGKRILSVGFGSADLLNILLCLILFLLTSIIRHGAQLEDDQKLTV
jgi:hypothetical protein